MKYSWRKYLRYRLLSFQFSIEISVWNTYTVSKKKSSKSKSKHLLPSFCERFKQKLTLLIATMEVLFARNKWLPHPCTCLIDFSEFHGSSSYTWFRVNAKKTLRSVLLLQSRFTQHVRAAWNGGSVWRNDQTAEPRSDRTGILSGKDELHIVCEILFSISDSPSVYMYMLQL